MGFKPVELYVVKNSTSLGVQFTRLLNIATSAHYWYYYFASRLSGWKPDSEQTDAKLQFRTITQG